MISMEFTALALEYQRDYGNARRNLNFSDLVNETASDCPVRIFGLGFQEETSNSILAEFCTLFDNSSDPLLVGLNGPNPLQ